MTTELLVHYTQEVISEQHAKEQYGDWHAEYDFDVVGVSLKSEDKWGRGEQFTLEADIAYADIVHVLWITHSTGDSFGHSTGSGEVLWVFKDPTLAWAAYTKWNEAKDGNRDSGDKYYSVSFEVDGGRTITLNNPGWGYFESLESVKLKQFLVDVI